jgi:hypothetical protein
MNRAVGTLVVAFLLSGTAFGVDLLENGDFEQDLSIGWTQEVVGGDYTFDRSTTYHSDPDYEVYVRKYLTGYALLKQTVPVLNLNLEFSGQVSFANACQENTYGYFAASAIRLIYEDDAGDLLGETRIYRGTSRCDWANSQTLHLIEMPGDAWDSFQVTVADEMTYLPGVNPGDIARITVGVYAYSTDYC